MTAAGNDDLDRVDPELVFLVRAEHGEYRIVAEIEDTLPSERWTELLCSHPEMSLRGRLEVSALGDALSSWRELHPIGRDEYRRRRDEFRRTGKITPSEPEIQREEEHRALVAHMRRSRQLTPLEREALELKRFGLSIEELARVFQLTRQVVRVRLELALETLDVRTFAEASEKLSR